MLQIISRGWLKSQTSTSNKSTAGIEDEKLVDSTFLGKMNFKFTWVEDDVSGESKLVKFKFQACEGNKLRFLRSGNFGLYE